jgi:hypothetical protein
MRIPSIISAISLCAALAAFTLPAMAQSTTTAPAANPGTEMQQTPSNQQVGGSQPAGEVGQQLQAHPDLKKWTAPPNSKQE